jgi:predicted DNA-binding ArsR family transcriptional regulator
MSLQNSEWKMWRNVPGFSQRFRGILSENHNTITAEWEKSDNGQKWEHDFNVKYTRIAAESGSERSGLRHSQLK